MALGMEILLLAGLTTVVIAMFIFFIILIRPKPSGGSAFVEAPKRTAPPECPYYLGHLRSLQKNNPVPDECFSCPKLMECLERHEKAKEKK